MGNIIHHTVQDRLTREDIGKIELSVCGRHRVYPLVAGAGITLTTGAGADEWGSWTEVIPYGTIPFDFVIIGLYIETISATGIYHVQIGSAETPTATPSTNNILGEIRFKGTSPITLSTQLLLLGARGSNANSRILGRTKNDSGGDNLTISAQIRKYAEVSAEVERHPTFPW